jgi:hypothetical protein
VDVPNGGRALATTEDPSTVARMQEDEEWVGREVQIRDRELV